MTFWIGTKSKVTDRVV